MVFDIFLALFGLIGLYFGAEYMLRGAVNLAAALRVRPAIIGLTVVAAGTSSPELVSNLIAAYQGSTDIAMGNVIGSNIANIGAVLGIGALIYPLTFPRSEARRELPTAIFFSLAAALLVLDGSLSRYDGLALFVTLSGFNSYVLYSLLRSDRKGAPPSFAEQEALELIEQRGRTLIAQITITIAGLIGVLLGAWALIEGALSIARSIGISETLIGLTLVAIGTSLPELATTIVAALKHHVELAVATALGSSIFNIGLILGLTAILKDIPVEPGFVRIEMLVALGYSIALIPFAIKGSIGRWGGAALLGSYLVILALVIARG